MDKIHQVILDGINENIAALVQTGKNNANNTIYTTTI